MIYTGNQVDAPIIIDKEKQIFYKNPMFYALGHITRFLAEGSTILETSLETNGTDVSAVSAVRPDGGIAVVLLNR